MKKITRNHPIEIRFWRHVLKTETCWLWTGVLQTNTGYGHVTFTDKSTGKQKKVGAHRVSWEISKGKIPKGMSVLHKCDVRTCVRPSHLFLGTQRNNVGDMVKKGRARFNHKNRKIGKHNNKSKLTNRQVYEIRCKYIPFVYTQRMLASEYSVDQQVIWSVIHKRTWKHV